jgi:hypothetical protein
MCQMWPELAAPGPSTAHTCMIRAQRFVVRVSIAAYGYVPVSAYSGGIKVSSFLTYRGHFGRINTWIWVRTRITYPCPYNYAVRE